MNIQTTLSRSRTAGIRRELTLAPGNTFVRCLTARAIAALSRTSPDDVAAERWPNDKTVMQILTRAVSAPAMSGTAGWAAELVQTMVHDALTALGPASAGAQLLKRSTVLNGDGIISAPGFVASSGNADFVAEGAPIPVRQLADASVQLSPHKLAAIAVLTEEMMRSSNAETLIGDTLIRSAAAALDLRLFDQVSGNTVRPSGLRNGIATLTASANADAWTAYFEDTSALINAVSQVCGNGPFVLITTPGLATEIVLRSWGGSVAPFDILYSNNLGGNIVLAVAPEAIVCALAPEPEIEMSNATTLHMNDAPSVIVNGGTMAVGTKNMFQTDAIALKMRWPVTWALRDPRGVAWLTPTWK